MKLKQAIDIGSANLDSIVEQGSVGPNEVGDVLSNVNRVNRMYKMTGLSRWIIRRGTSGL